LRSCVDLLSGVGGILLTSNKLSNPSIRHSLISLLYGTEDDSGMDR